jgi:hypothetical protein
VEAEYQKNPCSSMLIRDCLFLIHQLATYFEGAAIEGAMFALRPGRSILGTPGRFLLAFCSPIATIAVYSSFHRFVIEVVVA